MLQSKMSNKFYIGQTTNFSNRMASYKSDRRLNTKIQKAIKKYGWDNFDKLILDIAYSKEELDTLEQFYIEKFNSIEFGYNLTNGGSNGKHTLEAKLKISEAAKKRRVPMSELTKAKIANSKIGKIRKSLSSDTKNKISISMKKYFILNPS